MSRTEPFKKIAEEAQAVSKLVRIVMDLENHINNTSNEHLSNRSNQSNPTRGDYRKSSPLDVIKTHCNDCQKLRKEKDSISKAYITLQEQIDSSKDYYKNQYEQKSSKLAKKYQQTEKDLQKITQDRNYLNQIIKTLKNNVNQKQSNNNKKYQQIEAEYNKLKQKYKQFQSFAVQRCHIYQKTLVELNRQLNNHVKIVCTNIQKLVQAYKDTQTTNRNKKNYQSLSQQLKNKITLFNKINNIAKAKLGREWKQYQNQVSEHLTHSFNIQDIQIQKQYTYLKQIIEGICLDLQQYERENPSEKFKIEVFKYLKILKESIGQNDQ